VLIDDKSSVIGIVGGLGPQAGIDLANKIIKQTNAFIDQDHISLILMSLPSYVADRTDYLQGRISINPGLAIADIVKSLEDVGAGVIGIPCNTVHANPIWRIVLQDIDRRESKVKLVNMIVETVAYIESNWPEVRNVGVLGTNGAVESRVYSECLISKDMCAILPDYHTQNNVVHPSIVGKKYGIKANPDIPSDRARNNLLHAASELVAKGAELIVSGCTEIPLVIKEDMIDNVHIIDPTLVLARSLIRSTSPEKLCESFNNSC
tara:strand:+ start:2518 stop:3309 length:792 start_codon:yes stop_codon:yes gene_type:complete